MKPFYIILFLCTCLASCINSGSTEKTCKDAADSEFHPLITFANKTQNFGKINKETRQLHYVNFEFENTGKAPLVIFEVKVSCGCLSSLYPKRPVMSGEKDSMRIFINPNNQSGTFNKTITVKSNAKNNMEILRLKGKIVK